MSHPTAPAADSGSFATIGQRVGAYFIDAAIGVGLYLVFFVLVLATQAPALLVLGYLVLLGYGVFVLFLTATHGYTPGKKALGIRVVDATTLKPIGWGRAIGRGVVLGLLGALCGLPLLIAAVVANGHPKRQGWHDLAVNSVVVPEAALGRETPAAVPPPARAVPPVSLASGPPPPPSPGLSPTSIDAPAAIVPPPRPPGISSTSAPPPPPPPPPPPAPTPPAPSRPLPDHGPSMVPPPPGVPMVPPPPGMSPVSPPRPESPQESMASPVDEATRMSARRMPTSPSWTLAPTVGSALVVVGDTLIGRDPDASLVAGALPWAVDDPDRTVSKTHAMAGLDGDGLWIEDWNSTNGVAIRRGGVATELVPRERTPLQDGDVVLLGDLEINIRQGV